MFYKYGERTDPCGTPERQDPVLEYVLLTDGFRKMAGIELHLSDRRFVQSGSTATYWGIMQVGREKLSLDKSE
ncbi:hypothetical protein TNCV_4667691 [Trichonephila clavipes]|nr:hypothetical protein TNCV_4667691 [Trichonephila clavipes]